MKKIHIASICEVHQDGEIFNSVIHGDEDSVIKGVNRYFESEAAEGHEVDGAVFKSLSDIDGVDLSDNDDDRHYRIVVTSLEFETSYEAYTKSKMADYGYGNPKEAAFEKTFLSELNHQPFSEKKFAEALCHEHPTLQQLFFRLVKQCMLTRAELTCCSDERNEASVRMCRDLAEVVGKYPLPLR